MKACFSLQHSAPVNPNRNHQSVGHQRIELPHSKCRDFARHSPGQCIWIKLHVTGLPACWCGLVPFLVPRLRWLGNEARCGQVILSNFCVVYRIFRQQTMAAHPVHVIKYCVQTASVVFQSFHRRFSQVEYTMIVQTFFASLTITPYQALPLHCTCSSVRVPPSPSLQLCWAGLGPRIVRVRISLETRHGQHEQC